MRTKSLGFLSLAVAAMATAGAAAADDKPLTERKETVESAVATPVEDLNIMRTKIPEVLIRAQANPYDLSTTPTCEAVAAEIDALDAELGDDHDDKVMAQAEGEEKDSKGPSAGALLKAGVAQAIPFRGIVRQLSGAAQHDAAVDKAIDAGFARRGFLKGRALEMNCAPGAAPAWFTPRPEKEEEKAAEIAASAPPPAPQSETMTAVAEARVDPRPPIEAAPLPLLSTATAEADVQPAPAPAIIPSPEPQPGTLDAQLAAQ